MARKTMRKSDIKILSTQVDKFGMHLDKSDSVVQEDRYVFVNDNLWLSEVSTGGKCVQIPTVPFLLSFPDVISKKVPAIVVDMGAVKFVTNGADIMAPGIVDFPDGIVIGDVVCIIDENNKKPLAVGLAMINSEGFKETPEGKVITNLHYVGDEIWARATQK